MIRLAVGEIRSNLSEIMNRIAYGGERVIVQRREKDIVAVISLADLALLEKIEDAYDVEDALKAIEESEERISQEEIGKKLGLI